MPSVLIDTSLVINTRQTTSIDTVLHILNGSGNAINPYLIVTGNSSFPKSSVPINSYVTVYHPTSAAPIFAATNAMCVSQANLAQTIAAYICAAKGASIANVHVFTQGNPANNTATHIAMFVQAPSNRALGSLPAYIVGSNTINAQVNAFVMGLINTSTKQIPAYIHGFSSTQTTAMALIIASAGSITRVQTYISA